MRLAFTAPRRIRLMWRHAMRIPAQARTLMGWQAKRDFDEDCARMLGMAWKTIPRLRGIRSFQIAF